MAATSSNFYIVSGFLSVPVGDSLTQVPFHPLGFQDYEDALVDAAQHQISDLRSYCKSDGGNGLIYSGKNFLCNPLVAAMVTSLEAPVPTRQFLLKQQENIWAAHETLLSAVCGYHITKISEELIDCQNILVNQRGEVVGLYVTYEDGKVAREAQQGCQLFILKGIMSASPSSELSIVLELAECPA